MRPELEFVPLQSIGEQFLPQSNVQMRGFPRETPSSDEPNSDISVPSQSGIRPHPDVQPDHKIAEGTQSIHALNHPSVSDPRPEQGPEMPEGGPIMVGQDHAGIEMESQASDEISTSRCEDQGNQVIMEPEGGVNNSRTNGSKQSMSRAIENSESERPSLDLNKKLVVWSLSPQLQDPVTRGTPFRQDRPNPSPIHDTSALAVVLMSDHETGMAQPIKTAPEVAIQLAQFQEWIQSREVAPVNLGFLTPPPKRSQKQSVNHAEVRKSLVAEAVRQRRAESILNARTPSKNQAMEVDRQELSEELDTLPLSQF